MKARSAIAKQPRSLVPTLVSVLVGTVVLASCGGSSEEDLTRSDFIAEAETVCLRFKDASATREVDFTQALSRSDLESAAENFEQQGAASSAMLDQLEEIEAPVGDQPMIDQIIAVGRERARVAAEAADAIVAGDKERMIAAGKTGTVLAGEFDQLADSFGLTACGSGRAEEVASGNAGEGQSSTRQP